jgi:hypothetical protein
VFFLCIVSSVFIALILCLSNPKRLICKAMYIHVILFLQALRQPDTSLFFSQLKTRLCFAFNFPSISCKVCVLCCCLSHHNVMLYVSSSIKFTYVHDAAMYVSEVTVALYFGDSSRQNGNPIFCSLFSSLLR